MTAVTRNLSKGQSPASSSQWAKVLVFKRSRDLLLYHNRREDRMGGIPVAAASRQEVRWLLRDCCSHFSSEFWEAPPHLPGRTKPELGGVFWGVIFFYRDKHNIYKDSFIFFPIFIPFISFSCLIHISDLR